MIVVAIVGMAGSGKSELAQHLGSKGFPVIRFGQVVIDEINRQRRDINPQNERDIREDLRRTEGMDVCARRSLSVIRLELERNSMVVIDGLYSWSEYRTLKQELGENLVVLLVFTSRRVRYVRLQTRAERPLTLQEAEDRDFTEIENIEKGGPIAIADHILLNDGTKEELFAAADDLLAGWRMHGLLGDVCG